VAARCRQWLGAAAVTLLTCTTAAHAELIERDRISLASVEVTLKLERDAADALRRNDTARLRGLATSVRTMSALAASEITKLERARTAAAIQNIGPCLRAGLTLRQAIIGFADGRLKPRLRADVIDANPPDLTDQFAAHMQRCELTERTEPSARKIGGSCLIDGLRCRDSER
jgi:hypothetical protein